MTWKEIDPEPIRTYLTQIELPAIIAISDSSPWVNVRGSEFANKEQAKAFFERAKSEHEFPVRFIQRVQFPGGASAEEIAHKRYFDSDEIQEIARLICEAIPSTWSDNEDEDPIEDRVQAILVAKSRMMEMP